MMTLIPQKNMALRVLNHLYNLDFDGTALGLLMRLKWSMSYTLSWNVTEGRLDKMTHWCIRFSFRTSTPILFWSVTNMLCRSTL